MTVYLILGTKLKMVICAQRNVYIFPGPNSNHKVIDLVFVLDASGSIRRERFPLILKYVTHIIQTLEIGPGNTLVAVVVFRYVV